MWPEPAGGIPFRKVSFHHVEQRRCHCQPTRLRQPLPRHRQAKVSSVSLFSSNSTQAHPTQSNTIQLTSPPLTSIHGLNLPVPETARDVIKPWDARDSTDKYAESNVDDQLIIHIPFLESVRIKSILIKTGRGDLAPQNLNIYTNAPTIVDFADAESGDVKPQLEIALKTDEPGVVEYPVKASVFGNISTLSLFFVSLNLWLARLSTAHLRLMIERLGGRRRIEDLLFGVQRRSPIATISRAVRA